MSTVLPTTPARRPRVRLYALLVVLLWLGIVGGALGQLSAKLAEVQDNDNASFLPSSAESTRALELEAGFADNADVFPAIVLYEREGGLTPADLAAVAQDRTAFAELPALRGEVSPPIPSQDREAVQLLVPLDGTDIEGFPASVEQIRSVVDRPDLPAYVTGPGGLAADLFAVFGDIDAQLLLATAAVVVVILLVVYRSPVLWILPLLSAGLAFTLAGGLIYLLADAGALTLNGQSQGILTVLVFGAGTDYALLLIARYREELHRFDQPYDAMRVALRSAVPAIVASAATVVLGLLCLLASDLASNRGLGPVSAIGIGSALLAMTTLLPALLLLVGRRVFWPRTPRVEPAGYVEQGVWTRVAGLVGRRSRAVAAVTGAGLLALALLAPGLQADGLSTTEQFTSPTDSTRGLEVLAEHYPAGSGQPVTVVTQAPAAEAVAEQVRRDPDVAEVVAFPPAGQLRVVDGRVLLNATLRVGGDGEEAQAVVERLRSSLDAVPGADALVGGATAITLDVQDASQRDNRVIIPLVLLVILVVLGILLRSVVAPLMLVGTVVLSFAATLGVCRLVFDHVFGFAGADSAFPLFAFVFLVALGIDYNIFLMTRVREEALHSGTRTGTLRGLAVTGGVITSAGVVLAATFGVLGVLPLVFLAELGFAVAFGVLLDTLIVRSLLVPALTLELGDRVWWPSRLSRAS